MKFFCIFLLSVLLVSCKGIGKVLKNPDPAYKLRMAEQYYAKGKYVYAQQIYEDIMPYYKGKQEFEDIYYKYAYTAFNQRDYLNAENLFKTYLEIFPNSPRAEEVDYMRAFTFYKQSPKPALDQTNTIKAIGMMQTFINTHPGSARNKEANEIIDLCRKKLETKDLSTAKLYYDMGQFRAAAVSYATLLNNFPESVRSEEYQLMVIKAYYRLAELSVEEKKTERFQKVVEECHEFTDRFPQSALSTEVEHFLNLSQTNIKSFSNEQTKTST